MSFQNVFSDLIQRGEIKLGSDVSDLSLYAKLRLCPQILASMIDGELVSKIEGEFVNKIYPDFFREIEEENDPEETSIYTIMITDSLFKKYNDIVKNNAAKYYVSKENGRRFENGDYLLDYQLERDGFSGTDLRRADLIHGFGYNLEALGEEGLKVVRRQMIERNKRYVKEKKDVRSKSSLDNFFFGGDENFVEDFFNKSDAFIAKAKGYVNVI